MVYAKYKRGDYTAFKREEFIPMASLPVPAARFISIKGFGTCAIKPSDTLKMEIQKDNAGKIKFSMLNDTLVITANTNDLDGGQNKGLVNIYLPASVQLIGANCTFRVWGSNDYPSATSYNISLRNSYLFMNFNGGKGGAIYFNQLNITSVSSMIDLNNRATVNDLNLDFTDSKLNDQSAAIKKITMRSDDKSSLELSGKNANALK